MSALQDVGLQEPPRKTETKAKMTVKDQVVLHDKYSNALDFVT